MEILFTAFVKATGWSIINSLWQGAILYALLLILFLFNPKLMAKTRHNLAFMALLGMFIWFVQTFYSQLSKALEVGKNSGGLSLPLPVNYSVSVSEIGSSLLLIKAEQSIPLIVLIYSAGLIAQIIFLLVGYHRVYQIKSRGITDLSDELNAKFFHLSRKLDIKRIVRFAQSSNVSVPLVIGYLKPIVLLPLSVLTQFTPQQLEAIIIHELSHIRRNDYLLNILKVSIETILFFNPFVWLIGKLIGTERENACDDLVLKITGNPLAYALTLLELEKIKHQDQLFSMAITGKRYYLLNRIKRITNMEASAVSLKFQLFAIMVAVFGILSLAWSPVEKEQTFPETSLKVDGPYAAMKSPAVKIAHSTPLNVNLGFTKKKAFNAMSEDGNDSGKLFDNISDVPENINTDFFKENLNDSKLTIAGQSKSLISALPNDSAKSIIWIDKEGKIISADAKIIYYSKTLPGYTIDKDGNILDGHRNLLDKLAGGKPIIKVDSTGEMSRSYPKLTGIRRNDNIQTADINSRVVGLTSARNIPNNLGNSNNTVNAITSTANLSTVKTLAGIMTGGGSKTLNTGTTKNMKYDAGDFNPIEK